LVVFKRQYTFTQRFLKSLVEPLMPLNNSISL
jgi:hypothetical protein